MRFRAASTHKLPDSLRPNRRRCGRPPTKSAFVLPLSERCLATTGTTTAAAAGLGRCPVSLARLANDRHATRKSDPMVQLQRVGGRRPRCLPKKRRNIAGLPRNAQLCAR